MKSIFGSHDDNTIAQFHDISHGEGVAHSALMSDGHLGYVMPIGGVVAYRNKVSVAGVGFDIACGNAAIMTDLSISDLRNRERIEEIADQIQSELSFGIGRKNTSDDSPDNHPLFEDDRWNLIDSKFRKDLRDKARSQLGTIGSGNHYVDVFIDDKGRVWVGVHFGSRGFGHTVATAFLAIAAGKNWGDKVPETDVAILDLDRPSGYDYWHLMSLAGEYAYAGREWVARKVVSILGGNEVDLVHNHHNFAWKEVHYGEQLVVVRKGATPAWAGQRGFVGGSMGDKSVILRGYESVNSPSALYSTVHGAGRVMSRTAAAGKTKIRKSWVCGMRDCNGSLPIQTKTEDGSNPRCPKCGGKTHRRKVKEVIRPGKISRDMMNEWLEKVGVVLRGGGLDESPHVYRRLPDVLQSQGDTIEILETLTPVIVVMAGEDEYDPFKD